MGSSIEPKGQLLEIGGQNRPVSSMAPPPPVRADSGNFNNVLHEQFHMYSANQPKQEVSFRPQSNSGQYY